MDQWNEIEDPDIKPLTHEHLIFTNKPKLYKRVNFFITAKSLIFSLYQYISVYIYVDKAYNNKIRQARIHTVQVTTTAFCVLPVCITL